MDPVPALVVVVAVSGVVKKPKVTRAGHTAVSAAAALGMGRRDACSCLACGTVVGGGGRWSWRLWGGGVAGLPWGQPLRSL